MAEIDAIAKEKKHDSFFFANSGGNVRGGPQSRPARQSCPRGSRRTIRAAHTTMQPFGISLQGPCLQSVLM